MSRIAVRRGSKATRIRRLLPHGRNSLKFAYRDPFKPVHEGAAKTSSVRFEHVDRNDDIFPVIVAESREPVTKLVRVLDDPGHGSSIMISF
jgi:hypothetical protein